MEVGSIEARWGRSEVERPRRLRAGDWLLRWSLTATAALILAVILFFVITLYGEAQPAFARFGLWDFAFGSDWSVPNETFGARPLLIGTLVSSAIALVLGVPVAVSAALYAQELCPRRLRAPLTTLIDLLAAVPSVVYGLWGVFVLIPALKPLQQALADGLSLLPLAGGTVAGPSLFIGGVILAVMIVPIVSAISREVIATVPASHREAALALGATRWEMLRMAVLPHARAGICGAAMLGLGRALGETIAVVLVVGNFPGMPESIFSQGYTLAAVIANEFGEATGVHRSALFAAGLVLFVLTLFVNAAARAFVVRGERGARRGAAR